MLMQINEWRLRTGREDERDRSSRKRSNAMRCQRTRARRSTEPLLI